MALIPTAYKLICDCCNKELIKSELSFDCNDTGYRDDRYTIDFCSIECLKMYKLHLESKYSEKELEEFSSYYKVLEYLEKRFSEEVFN